MSGQSPTAAANLAGVDRATVYRWRKADLHFIAALNACQREVHQTTGDYLLSGLQQAAKNVLESVRQGNVSVSLKLLKAMDALKPTPPGHDTAELVRQHLQRVLGKESYELIQERRRPRKSPRAAQLRPMGKKHHRGRRSLRQVEQRLPQIP